MYSTQTIRASSLGVRKLESGEKVIGTPVENPNPQAIDVDQPTANNAIIGTYVYQPNPTTVPTNVYELFANSDMNQFKTVFEAQANVKLRYARFSWNYEITDPYGNYVDVTDLVVGLVFETKTNSGTPVNIENAALAVPWFSEMWYACNMQNGALQAWLLGTAGGDNTWLLVIGVVALATVGIVLLVRRR